MAHTFKHSVDSVIISRGADPTVPGIYLLVDQGDGPFIAEWMPPDASYGAKPTQEELDAVTDEEAEEAEDVDVTAQASRMLNRSPVSLAIVDVLSSVAGEDVTDQVLAAIKSKL